VISRGVVSRLDLDTHFVPDFALGEQLLATKIAGSVVHETPILSATFYRLGWETTAEKRKMKRGDRKVELD